MTCSVMTLGVACFTDENGVSSNVFAHYEYAENSAGLIIVAKIRYTDAATNPVNTSLGTVVPGACCCEGIGIANGADIPDAATNWPFPLAITEVRTFTLSVVGASPVTVTFSGSTMVVHPGQSRSWGNGDGKGLIDVSTVSFTTGANSNADVVWEDI